MIPCCLLSTNGRRRGVPFLLFLKTSVKLPTFSKPESSLLMFAFELVNLTQTWKETAGNVHFTTTQTILPPVLPCSGLGSKFGGEKKILTFAGSTVKIFHIPRALNHLHLTGQHPPLSFFPPPRGQGSIREGHWNPMAFH